MSAVWKETYRNPLPLPGTEIISVEWGFDNTETLSKIERWGTDQKYRFILTGYYQLQIASVRTQSIQFRNYCRNIAGPNILTYLIQQITVTGSKTGFGYNTQAAASGTTLFPAPDGSDLTDDLTLYFKLKPAFITPLMTYTLSLGSAAGETTDRRGSLTYIETFHYEHLIPYMPLLVGGQELQ